MRWPFKGLRIEWSQKKNAELIRDRNVSFEDVAVAIKEDLVIDVIPHWDKETYAHQQVIVVILKGYIHAVPCVVDNEKAFLKTIFPSRKIAQRYSSDL